MSIDFAIEPIEQSGPSRRQREREAIARLIERCLGEGLVLSHTADGSPCIEGSPISLSLSHSRLYAALAWTDGQPIGIDIEEHRPAQFKKIARRFLSAEELPVYGQSSALLLKAWTLKEAAFKALRNGPADLRKYILPLDNTNIIYVENVLLEIVRSAPVGDEAWLSIVRKL